MGVRYLFTLVKEFSCLQNVRLESGSEDMKSKVVVDVLSFMQEFFEHDMICDFRSMRQRVRQFVQNWKDLGVECIAVIDGSVDVAKLNTWVGRRARDLGRVKTLMQKLTQQKYLTTSDWKPVTSSSYYLGQAFEDAGCKVHYTHCEADKVITHLAQADDVLGVLALDTDFIIFEFPGYYMCSDSLRWEYNNQGAIAVTFTYVDVDALLSKLKMSKIHLKAYACMLGCDVNKKSQDEIFKLKEKLDPKRESRDVKFGVIREIEKMSEDDIKQLPDFDLVDDFYKPAELGSSVKDEKQPTMLCLKINGLYRRGVCVENVMDNATCYKTLSPLRKRVYQRLRQEGRITTDVIQEHLCHPDESVEDWLKGTAVSFKLAKAAPKPKEDMPGLLNQILDLLKDFVSPDYIALLKKQFHQRLQHMPQPKDINQRIYPRPEDIHVRNLFLQCWELFCLGYPESKVWDIFDGVSFHFFCNEHFAQYQQPSIHYDSQWNSYQQPYYNQGRSYNPHNREIHTPNRYGDYRGRRYPY